MTKSKPAPKEPEPRLLVNNEVARCVRQHARRSMKTEVCGVLIGEVRNGVIEVRASIEGLNAAQAGTHVTFTQDAWEAIYRVKDESYPDDRIVGWYHSHPGFGVFLSEHDTFIHRNFFSSPDQVAWVYDPHSDEEGCFGWIDGDIHRIPLFSMIDNNGDGTERTPKGSESMIADDDEQRSSVLQRENRSDAPPAWLRWSVTTFSYLSALAVGFLVAYFLFPRFVAIPVDPVTGEPLLLQPRQTQSPNPRDPAESGGSPAPKTAPAVPPATPAPGASPERKK
jgi:proteasome lid subunit RPN8/RPN11